MSGHNDLRDCAHADGVCADDSEHAALGTTFEGWAGGVAIRAFVDLPRDVQAFNALEEFQAQVEIVCVRERQEPRAERVQVQPSQGVLSCESGQVDVVVDHHEVAGRVRLVHASGGVRHQEQRHAQPLGDPDGQRVGKERVSFVIMESANHAHHRCGVGAEMAEHQLSVVAWDLGRLESGDVAVADLHLAVFLVRLEQFRQPVQA